MEEDKNPFVALAGIIAGITMVMLLAVAIFAQSQMWILMPVSGAMALLGIVLGYFMSKPRRLRA